MTSKDVIRIIKEARIPLRRSYSYSYKYYYIKDYIDKYPQSGPRTQSEEKLWETIYALVAINFDDYATEDNIDYVIFVLKNMFKGVCWDDAIGIRKIIEFAKKNNNCSIIIDILSGGDLEKNSMLLSGDTPANINYYLNTIFDLNYRLSRGNCDVIPFFELIKRAPNKLEQMVIYCLYYNELLFLKRIQDMDDKKNSNIIGTSNPSKSEEINGIHSVAAKIEFVKKVQSSKDKKYSFISMLIDDIYRYVEKEEEKEKRFSAFNRTQIEALDNAQKRITKAVKNSELITDYKDIIQNIKSEDVKIAILQFVLEHNSAVKEQLQQQLEQIRANDVDNYKALLNKYQIRMTAGVNPESFKKYTPEQFETMLKYIVHCKFDNKTAMNILITTSYDRFTEVVNHVKKNYIPFEYIIQTPEIFSLQSRLFTTYLSNLDVLGENNINPMLFASTPELLFDCTYFATNIQILKSYGLLDCIKNNSSQDYSFLLNPRLVELIDRFIELGYEDFLRKDLALLNTPNFKRLEFFNATNYELDSYEELVRELTRTDFYNIKEEDLDDYIYNALNINDRRKTQISSDIDISEYRTANIYNFGGVIVSALKVDRLLREGKSLFDAITYNLILSENQYDELIKSLRPITY